MKELKDFFLTLLFGLGALLSGIGLGTLKFDILMFGICFIIYSSIFAIVFKVEKLEEMLKNVRKK